MDNNSNTSENIRDDASDTSDFHSIPPYAKTPSPPIPVRNVPTPSGSSTSPVPYPRIGQLEDQRKVHAEARMNQAAKNSVTSIASKRSVKQPPGTDEMIVNGPGGGGDPQEDGFDDTESVLNAELVSEEEASARDIEVVVKNAIFDLFVLVPLLIIPSVLVYFLLDFPVYNLFTTKLSGLNVCMEFIRYSVFATLSYALYVIIDVFSLVLPEMVLMYTPVVKGNKATKVIRSQMHLLIKVRNYVTIAAWLSALLPIAAAILYESMFLTPWQLLTNTLNTTTATKPSSNDDIIQAEKYVSLQMNFEVGLLLLAIFSAILAVEKYFIQMISLNFHRMAFADRISECNKKFGHLIKLYEAIKFGKPRVLSSHSMSLLDLDSSAELSSHNSIQLTSVHRAKSIARIIYRTLLPDQEGVERDYLIVDDFKKWSSRPKEMFDAFDIDGRGEKISYRDLEEAVIEIYNTRCHLVKGLKSNGKIVSKLDSLFTIIALACGAALSTPIFDIGAGKLFVSISALSAGFGFMFHSTAKSCFESLLFVFIQHPFDVGDRVIIDEESFIVEDIEVFTTKMTRWDGVKVYISNSTLCSKVIQNIRRSEDQFESVGIKIKSDTMSESLWTFRNELKKQLLAHENNFTGVMDLINMEKLPSRDEPLSVTIVAQVRGNFQNSAKKNLRRTEFLKIVESSLKNSNINKA